MDSVNGDQLRTTVTNVIPAGIQLRTGAVDQGSLAGDLLGSVLLLDPQTAQPQTTPEERALALDALRGGGFVDFDGNVAPHSSRSSSPAAVTPRTPVAIVAP